ncbi:MAG: hypothetical protein ACRD5Z_14490, partial [Bryobacteraceae bacterium]
MSNEERHAEFLLEALDLLTEGRLRDPQGFRRPRKISGFGDLYEVFELPQIHPKLIYSSEWRSIRRKSICENDCPLPEIPEFKQRFGKNTVALNVSRTPSIGFAYILDRKLVFVQWISLPLAPRQARLVGRAAVADGCARFDGVANGSTRTRARAPHRRVIQTSSKRFSATGSPLPSQRSPRS